VRLSGGPRLLGSSSTLSRAHDRPCPMVGGLLQGARAAATAVELPGNTAMAKGGRKGNKGGNSGLIANDTGELDGTDLRRGERRWSASDGNGQGKDDGAGWLAEAGARGDGRGGFMLRGPAMASGRRGGRREGPTVGLETSRGSSIPRAGERSSAREPYSGTYCCII
jgi:hypothetical protein